ncbi:alpha/beta hydrolase [Spiribacter halobius]|uniref:Alpha/beta hydrolase n=1 Tax=Sediminicurvatus halobius TaxID=2182432 RepID=A0A2U2N8M2_9GAMM|nr:alpha/beta hydrolase [Spiribacter halobius]
MVMLHGWMDCGATFAPVAEALAPRAVIAPDWRGFGESDPTPGDTYWIPDYLADLDALLHRLSPETPVDLVGHSLGGNVAGLYAGVRPERVRRLVVVEGFGLPEPSPEQAPLRYREWLDSLAEPPAPRTYPDLAGLARRIARTHPGISEERAREVAELWSYAEQDGAGRRLRADPAHWRPLPTLYRLEETLACWRRIRAPVLWLYGGRSAYARRLRAAADWPRRCEAIRDLRQAQIPTSGHAPHLSHPLELAAHLRRFLDA